VEKYGTARQGTDGDIVRRMRIACWIPKSTNKFSENVTFIAFPSQQWLHERTSLLRLYVRTLPVLLLLNLKHYFNILERFE
jgi:hypothetical protein